jgi:hypothetical protein
MLRRSFDFGPDIEDPVGGDELPDAPPLLNVDESIGVLAACRDDVNPPVDGPGSFDGRLDLVGDLARGASYTFPSEPIKPRKPFSFTTRATAWRSSP